jgi:hypothetical protein
MQLPASFWFSVFIAFNWANKPAAGNAGVASQLAIGHHWPGVPEPERSAE